MFLWANKQPVTVEKTNAASDRLRWRGPLSGVRLTYALAVALLLGGCTSNGPTLTTPVYFPAQTRPAHVVHLISFNSIDELVLHHATFLERLRGRVGGDRVGTPAGIAYHDSHLYICDTSENLVHDWNLATGEISRIFGAGKVTFGEPVAVVVDNNGTLFVADTLRGQVVAISPDRQTATPLRPKDQKTFRPTSLAVRDHRLCVTDIATHAVDVFDISTFKTIRFVEKMGGDANSIYFPMGVATNDAGEWLVSDSMNGRVQVFDDDGKLVRSMGQLGDRYGDMAKPRHLCVGPDGVVFVADAEFARVHLFNKQGQFLMLFGGPEDQPGGTPMPVSVALATELPPHLKALVPADFDARYYVFTASTIGSKRLSLFAIGVGH